MLSDCIIDFYSLREYVLILRRRIDIHENRVNVRSDSFFYLEQ